MKKMTKVELKRLRDCITLLRLVSEDMSRFDWHCAAANSEELANDLASILKDEEDEGS